MEAGDPIVRALRAAEDGTRASLHVYVSRRLFERNAAERARGLFRRLGLGRGGRRTAILFYFNLRRHRFAIVADGEAHAALGQECWDELARAGTEHLRGTNPERAIAMTLAVLGSRLLARREGAGT